MSDKQETVADVVREMLDEPAIGHEVEMLLDYAERVDAAHNREVERLRKVLDSVEDQVRWTIAHITAGEYDDVTGALYTAEWPWNISKELRRVTK